VAAGQAEGEMTMTMAEFAERLNAAKRNYVHYDLPTLTIEEIAHRVGAAPFGVTVNGGGAWIDYPVDEGTARVLGIANGQAFVGSHILFMPWDTKAGRNKA
jgi:hypothetical protein